MDNKRPLKNILSPRNIRRIFKQNPNDCGVKVIIAIAHKNQPKELINAIKSALKQTAVLNGTASILILDDNSQLDINAYLRPYIITKKLMVIQADCGSPARARNCLLDYIDEYFDKVDWVARLDADDTFASVNAVQALYEKGDEHNKQFVIGSNLLNINGKVIGKNIANESILLSNKNLKNFIQAFCTGKETQELPSCNLLLKTNIGVRYPNIKSAEDHWLIASLLAFRAKQGCIVPSPFYANYALNGSDTLENRKNFIWAEQRLRLTEVFDTWYLLQEKNKNILGAGLEGVVYKEQNNIIKHYYSWTLNDDDVKVVQSLINQRVPCLPNATFFKKKNIWLCKYQDDQLQPFPVNITKDNVIKYLTTLYQNNIVTNNIKRDNLRINETGDLIYIDIGKDITPLTTSRFLDMSARLYAIAILNLPDEEWVRRQSTTPQDQALLKLKGFKVFYADLIDSLSLVKTTQDITLAINGYSKDSITNDVSLLIKACSQDAEVLYEQVHHIVSQLSSPCKFAKTTLLLDSYQGPFLRQYARPNFKKLLKIANILKDEHVIDSILVSPSNIPISDTENNVTSIQASNTTTIKTTYKKWFGCQDIVNTHTCNNAPLHAQLWAFDNVNTRYVLQCDLDVLIGRKNLTHDFLNDMLTAIKPDDVLSVGFNIPKPTNNFLPYHAPSNGFVPEVRFGLLDLDKITNILPLNNPIEDSQFTLMWHRAIEKKQHRSQYKSLRGGDPKSFYIHPLNQDKYNLGLLNETTLGIKEQNLHVVRDIISQGHYPIEQAENFDLIATANWQYPKRTEDIVFLLKGRNTATNKLKRCISSLEAQTNQNFGVIYIDDASEEALRSKQKINLANIYSKTTMINRQHHTGRMPNFIFAIEKICINNESLIVIIDQDDALMSVEVTNILMNSLKQGHDLIQLPMYRPNKALKLYQPDYKYSRAHSGKNVWAHMRCFKKSLFEKIPKTHLRLNNSWIDQVTDYATMLPMVELAKKPVFIDTKYCYLHQRDDYSKSKKNTQNQILKYLFSLTELDEENQSKQKICLQGLNKK
jgi:glycosyltransferase involved in cell wall biosynthesis